MTEYPAPQGLYDPRNEHDSCGVGFVAHIKGAKSHAIVSQALEILANLDHRGAVGADPLLGDGAGILLQIPDPLYRKWARGEGLTLPPPGDYAVAMCFLPQHDEAREFICGQFEKFIAKEGQTPDRLARRADHRGRPRQGGARLDADDPPVLHRAAAPTAPTRTRSSAS